MNPTKGALLSVSFRNHPCGEYSLAALASDFGPPAWSLGVEDGRTVILRDHQNGGAYLAVHYPRDTVNSHDCGAQWVTPLSRSYDRLHCSYRVRFEEGFQFNQGGKLPGLAGGAMNCGGNPPDPKNPQGWSARMMWRPGGEMIQYVYRAGQKGKYGDDLAWNCAFRPGRWSHVEHEIVMNDPDSNNGVIRGWLNGVLKLDVHGLRFRNDRSLGVDCFFFSTFFGGNTPEWASPRDQHVHFDDFAIATTRIGPDGVA